MEIVNVKTGIFGRNKMDRILKDERPEREKLIKKILMDTKGNISGEELMRVLRKKGLHCNNSNVLRWIRYYREELGY